MRRRPSFYFESPLGFEPVLASVLEELLELIRPIVVPINPFMIAGEEYIPGILEASGEVRQQRWNQMALRLYRIMRDEAEGAFSYLNGDPPDFGVGCEMGYGFCLHDTGIKRFPVLAYRDDLRRSGETDTNLNAMALPPYMETGGEFVTSREAIPEALEQIVFRLRQPTA